jgi:Tfp pilus assembly protein PilF
MKKAPMRKARTYRLDVAYSMEFFKRTARRNSDAQVEKIVGEKAKKVSSWGGCRDLAFYFTTRRARTAADRRLRTAMRIYKAGGRVIPLVWSYEEVS